MPKRDTFQQGPKRSTQVPIGEQQGPKASTTQEPQQGKKDSIKRDQPPKEKK